MKTWSVPLFACLSFISIPLQIQVEGILNAIKRMPLIQEVVIRLPLAMCEKWTQEVNLERMDNLRRFQTVLFTRSSHLHLLIFQSFMWIRKSGSVKFIAEPQKHPAMHATWPQFLGFYKQWNEDGQCYI